MTRWEPNARGRLEQAALELFDERGFGATMVEDIAARAGVTKRTFFRHFADKREALFGGSDWFQQLFLDGLATVAQDATPMDAATASLLAVGEAFHDRHDRARRRHRVISANTCLQERELVKLASVASALAAALRDRGTPEPTATITAETAIAVFRAAFDRWVSAEDPPLTDVLRESLRELQAVAGSG